MDKVIMLSNNRRKNSCLDCMLCETIHNIDSDVSLLFSQDSEIDFRTSCNGYVFISPAVIKRTQQSKV
jgi:hypothetical protein